MKEKTIKGITLKRLLSVALSFAMVLAILPLSNMTAYAESATQDITATVGTYTIKVPKYAEVTNTDSNTTVTEITSSTTTLDEGWYVVNSNIEISDQLVINGNVNIILVDGTTLTVDASSQQKKAAIKVSGDTNSLTIWGQSNGTGTIIAKGGQCGAGIGGATTGFDGTQNGENIIINGGTINATGGQYGAGIGGSARNAAHGLGNNIIINAGKVNATGGQYGAGIGGASQGNGENIIINGGEVTAIGGEKSAGIGGGNYGYGKNITINSGTVIANGSDNADGIGAGGNSSGGSSESIKAGADLSIKAGSSANPTEEVTNATPGTTDLASSLSGKQYVTVSYSIYSDAISLTASDFAIGNTVNEAIASLSGFDTEKLEVAGFLVADSSYQLKELTDELTAGTYNVQVALKVKNIGNIRFAHNNRLYTGDVTFNNISIDDKYVCDYYDASTGGSGVDDLLNTTASHLVTLFSVTITPTTINNTIVVTDIDAPVKGTALDTAGACATTGVATTAPEVTWKVGDVEKSEVAAAATAYTAYVTLESNAGYAFAETPSVTINGNTATVTRTDDTHITATYTFAATDDEPPAYTITKADATNGSFTVKNGTYEVSSVAKGTEITITPTANSGYEVDTVSVIDADNNTVSVTNNKFTMPEANVTVTVTFKASTPTVLLSNLSLDTTGKTLNEDGDFEVNFNYKISQVTGYQDEFYIDIYYVLKQGSEVVWTGNRGLYVLDLEGSEEIALFDIHLGMEYTLEITQIIVYGFPEVQAGEVSNEELLLTLNTGLPTITFTPIVITEVKSGSGAPAVTASGLEEIASAYSVSAGSHVTKITLTVDKAADENSDEATTIKAVDGASGKTIEYLDIQIKKTVDGTYDGNITDTGSNLIEINIPFDTNGKTNITVYRYHDGNAMAFTKITDENDKADATYMVNDGNITIWTTKFSTYAIGYDTVTCSSDDYSSSYSINVLTAANGAVTSSDKSAAAGKTVTIAVTPDKGYALETITVKTSAGKEVELTTVREGESYTFVMPGSNVSVEATFMEDNTMLNFFVDVKADDYYYDAVLWAATNGITKGTDETHFSPMEITTRAQLVTFLWNQAGQPEPKSMEIPFADVPENAYYAKAVAWAYENGITAGVSETSFAPQMKISRAQAVQFLYNVNAIDTLEIKDNPFSDVKEGTWYYDAVLWAVKNGVTAGTGDGTTFSPSKPCSRGQVVTLFYNYFAGNND